MLIFPLLLKPPHFILKNILKYGMGEFYINMIITPKTDGVSSLLKITRIIITKNLIQSIVELGKCDNQIFLHTSHPTLEGYSPYRKGY